MSFWSILFSRLWPVCTPPLATRCRLELASRFNSSLTVNCRSSVAVLPFSPTLSPRPSVLYYRMFDKHLPASVAMSSLLSALNSLFHILLRKCVSTYISYRHIYIYIHIIYIYTYDARSMHVYTHLCVASLVHACKAFVFVSQIDCCATVVVMSRGHAAAIFLDSAIIRMA